MYGEREAIWLAGFLETLILRGEPLVRPGGLNSHGGLGPLARLLLHYHHPTMYSQVYARPEVCCCDSEL